jgi:hypothetical protein
MPFDDGVLAVLGLDERDVLVAVGEKAEVPPVGPQLGLRAEQAGAAHDQPPAAIGGLGDLRLAGVGVVNALPGVPGIASTAARTVLIIRTPIENCQPACSSRSNTLVIQNPESARSNLTPVAPARWTRAINSTVSAASLSACSPTPS